MISINDEERHNNMDIREDLIVRLADVDIAQMLEFWRWLIPPTCCPLFATALGDLFLADAEHRIQWLDIGVGQLKQVASSIAEFENAVADPDNASLWFGASFIDELRTAGKTLASQECYSYIQLPMLGGEYEPANFRVYDVVTHFRVWGPIHEKLRDVPDGTQIEFEIV
jgi:hypothetical protein